MQRITANLEERQMERLTHQSKRTGAPQAEIIRRALNAYLDRLDEEEFQKAEYRTSPPPACRSDRPADNR